MTRLLLISILGFFLCSCANSQNNSENNFRLVGGPCQDCEATLEYQELNIKLKAIDTLPGFQANAPKIKITGTVFQNDGKTPAEDVILYVYHVDRNGIYQPSDEPVGWEKTHGQYRSWLKTGADGQFTFYTFRPAPYPEVQEPEHIHIYIKEPNTNAYYLDSYLFESDPTLTEEKMQNQDKRGGYSVVKLELKNGIWTANRDIILGLNIPDYE